jgi:lipopolysaccharide transport system permease protein
MSQIIYTDIHQGQVSRIIPELIRHRGLLGDFISKDLRARYRNAMIGFAWAILQPLLMTLILTLVFTLIGGRTGATGTSPSDAAILILCGLVPWQLFSSGVLSATHSLVENQHLIKKVHFPREILPLAAIANCLINFLIGFVLLVLACVAVGGTLGPALLWIPIVLVVELCLLTGLGLLLSALNVQYRDVLNIAEIGLMFGFYATPVFYPLSFVEQFAAGRPWISFLYFANPMTGIVSTFREAVMRNAAPEISMLLWPAVCGIVLLALGAIVFRRKAPLFADHL